MNDFLPVISQTPGIVEFRNYPEVRAHLQNYLQQFDGIDYDAAGMDAAKTDFEELKSARAIVKDWKDKLKQGYGAPYEDVMEKLEELDKLIKAPYDRARKYVEAHEKDEKEAIIRAYAVDAARKLQLPAERIVGSPAFFDGKWLNKGCNAKQWQVAVNAKLAQAAKDLQAIQAAASVDGERLVAVYYESLSMDSVRRVQETLRAQPGMVDASAIPSENNVLGYKVLKITGTEDQMAILLDQMALMGLEVEELEDGMPKPMGEHSQPDFDTFVAFDIETTGTNGAAAGDGEAAITEIGAVRVVNGVVTDRFDELAYPGRKITPYVSRVTHITDEMVAGKPPVDEVIRRFREFVGNSTLVGHNIAGCDLHYIKKAADHAGVAFDMPYLDTLPLARSLKDRLGIKKVSLSDLSAHFGIAHEEAHRAWSDAEVSAAVYLELKKLWEEK